MADQLWPHGADRVTLPGPYGPIAALRAKATDARATAVLVPGYTGAKEDFAPILQPLAAAGFTALALDQPGQYQSPGPDDESAYSPTALGTVLARVIGDSVPGPLVLLGHSFGGLVARAAVLAGLSVRGLTLLCSGPGAFAGGARLDALLLAEPILRSLGRPAAWQLRADLTERLRGPQRPDLQAYLKERFLSSSAAGLLGMAVALRTEPDRTAELAATGVPVSVVAGVDDNAWPLPDQARMARGLGTELVLVPGAAHSPAVENPDALMDVLLPRWTQWSEPAH